MNGLYELEAQRRFVEQTGFHDPKTGRPYAPEHPRYWSSLRMLKEISMAMESKRISVMRRE